MRLLEHGARQRDRTRVAVREAQANRRNGAGGVGYSLMPRILKPRAQVLRSVRDDPENQDQADPWTRNVCITPKLRPPRQPALAIRPPKRSRARLQQWPTARQNWARSWSHRVRSRRNSLRSRWSGRRPAVAGWARS